MIIQKKAPGQAVSIMEPPPIDFDDFARFFRSIDNTLPTEEILMLQKQSVKWIQKCNCGSVIYGEPRIGKTRAIYYIKEKLKERYGDELPIYEWDCTYHMGKSNTDKFFYTEIMRSIGLPDPPTRDSAQTLKKRIINSMLVTAAQTKYKNLILFIDEAQLLTERDYLFLIDLYNNLDRDNVFLITFLVGQPELLAIRRSFRESGKGQIIGRFMNEDFEFRGINSRNSMAFLLSTIDTKLEYYVDGDRINITRTFFPGSYSAGSNLVACGDALWQAFQQVNGTNKIKSKDVPMHYFINALLECFMEYGAVNGGSGIFPDIGGFIKCIESTGYKNRGFTAA